MSLFGRGNSPSVPPRQTPPPPVPARPKDDDAPARPRAHASRGGVARLSMEVSSCPSQDLALSNMVFLHPDDFASLSPNGEKVYVMLNGFVYTAAGNSGVGTGKVALNGVQRRITRTSGGDAVTLETFTPDSMITSVTYEVDLNLKVKGQAETVEHDEFAGKIRDRFKNQVMSMGQEIVMEFLGKNFLIKVVDMEAQATVKSGHKSHALLTVETEVMCRKVPEGGAVKIQGGERPNVGIIAPDWNFEKMGIGGLDKEFTDIFRRAFASRVFPPSVIKKLGLNHVKGARAPSRPPRSTNSTRPRHAPVRAPRHWQDAHRAANREDAERAGAQGGERARDPQQVRGRLGGEHPQPLQGRHRRPEGERGGQRAAHHHLRRDRRDLQAARLRPRRHRRPRHRRQPAPLDDRRRGFAQQHPRHRYDQPQGHDRRGDDPPRPPGDPDRDRPARQGRAPPDLQHPHPAHAREREAGPRRRPRLPRRPDEELHGRRDRVGRQGRRLLHAPAQTGAGEHPGDEPHGHAQVPQGPRRRPGYDGGLRAGAAGGPPRLRRTGGRDQGPDRGHHFVRREVRAPLELHQDLHRAAAAVRAAALPLYPAGRRGRDRQDVPRGEGRHRERVPLRKVREPGGTRRLLRGRQVLRRDEGLRRLVQVPSQRHRPGQHRAHPGLHGDRNALLERGPAGAPRPHQAPAAQGQEAADHRDDCGGVRAGDHGALRRLQHHPPRPLPGPRGVPRRRRADGGHGEGRPQQVRQRPRRRGHRHQEAAAGPRDGAHGGQFHQPPALRRVHARLRPVAYSCI